MFCTLGLTLSTLGSVPSNVYKVPKTTVNTFDGTDPKVDRIKPKVRNMIFSPVNHTLLQYYQLVSIWFSTAENDEFIFTQATLRADYSYLTAGITKTSQLGITLV